MAVGLLLVQGLEQIGVWHGCKSVVVSVVVDSCYDLIIYLIYDSYGILLWSLVLPVPLALILKSTIKSDDVVGLLYVGSIVAMIISCRLHMGWHKRRSNSDPDGNIKP